MPRSGTMKATTKATCVPVKNAGKSTSRTPSRTPSRSAKLTRVRDLRSMSDMVTLKAKQMVALAKTLDKLTPKTDSLSLAVEKAKKDQVDRVGKVEREIQLYQLEKVKTALVKHNKCVVDKVEMKALRGMEVLRKRNVDEEAKKLKAEVDRMVAEKVRFEEVKFEEQYATCLAQEKVFDAERRNMKASIAALRLEIESQKSLSSSLADTHRIHKINQARKKAIADAEAKEDLVRLGKPAPAAAAPPAAAAAAGKPPLPPQTPAAQIPAGVISGTDTDSDESEEPKPKKPAPKRRANSKQPPKRK
eukprot:TRINITY_DN7223_c0_g1_i1.p1 TRINITY_DN7223_c0_g1~~TRINITY_DN7223_c0_g1_i1.p1  ORF type:complete len:304 (+),score=150.18 TRINITY_DN7223_c0_g1_i1:52-963(+)